VGELLELYEGPEEERPAGGRFVFDVPLKELLLRDWRGASRISEAVLEREVSRHDSPAGAYDLVGVLGLPHGAPREERFLLAFDIPSDIGLIIAKPPTVTTPTAASFEFGVGSTS
jgi:hypothetical protein